MTDIMRAQAGKSLEARLDNNEYDETNLVEMRVSIDLPYQNDQAEFERFNGEIEINGVQYRYVKRKIEKGQLVVLCIADQDGMKIKSSGDDYFKMVNDLQQDQQGKKSEKSSSFAFKGLFNEYQAEDNNWGVNAPFALICKPTTSDTDLITSFTDMIPGQPPEVC
ncbi:MAG: hypothetical protein EOO02_00310 [Chitinophagaceae bacterium]|nr:MAG: hypothetical protein EOO02_00310 [Chitinophagaceae bacterium]